MCHWRELVAVLLLVVRVYFLDLQNTSLTGTGIGLTPTRHLARSARIHLIRLLCVLTALESHNIAARRCATAGLSATFHVQEVLDANLATTTTSRQRTIHLLMRRTLTINKINRNFSNAAIERLYSFPVLLASCLTI